MSGSTAAMEREGCHVYKCRVYYEDTDAGGIVYHANHLRFAERARTEMLRALDVPHSELTERHGLILVVRRVKVDYLRPARLDESLVVLTRLARLGTASAELEQEILGPDEVVRARLGVGIVCVDVATGRPAPLPGRWRDALEDLARSGTCPASTGGEQ